MMRSVVFLHSAADPLTMNTAVEFNTILVPVDGSDESMIAVRYAVEVATVYTADLHAIYIAPDEYTKPQRDESIDPGEVSETSQVVLEDVSGIAADNDVPIVCSSTIGFSTKYKLLHPGSAVLDTAEQINADFIVIPRENVHHESVNMLEKAAEYVISYASQPVLSV